MNDSSAPESLEAGELGYQPVNVEISTLYGLALALDGERQNMDAGAAEVIAKLSPEGEGYAQGASDGDEHLRSFDVGPEPLGTRPDYVGIQNTIERHSQAREQAQRTLLALCAGVERISQITNLLVSEFESQDELNAAGVEQVGDLTGIYPEGHENYVAPEDRVSLTETQVAGLARGLGVAGMISGLGSGGGGGGTADQAE